jgi:spore maturation protein CgeB
MNIFVCTHGPASAGTGTSQVWRVALIDTLRSMGHEVYETSFDWLSAYLPQLYPSLTREVRSEVLLKEVQQAHTEKGIDLLLTYFFNHHVEPEVIRRIGQMGIPTVNFFCDNIRFPKATDEIRHLFTLNWVPEWDATALYKKLGLPYIYLPMAADPKVYRPMGPLQEREMVFVGGADAERFRIVAGLLKSKIPIEVFGSGWDYGRTNNGASSKEEPTNNQPPLSSISPLVKLGKLAVNQRKIIKDYGVRGLYRKIHNTYTVRRHAPLAALCSKGTVSDEQMVRLYSEAKVTLGINRVFEIGSPRHRVKYSKLRDFEAPMSGACYLTEHCTDLEHNYEIGKELWTYDSESELIEKSTELLRHSSLRAELRVAARSAALARHTWTNRFRVLFERLSLN